jgi:hypothetical protein
MTNNTNTKPAVELSPERKDAIAKLEREAAKLQRRLNKADAGFEKFPEKRETIIAILTEAANGLAGEERGEAGAEYFALLEVFAKHKGWTNAERAAVSKHLKTRSPMCWTEADCRLADHCLDILDTHLACATLMTFDKYADDLVAIARALCGALSEKISERC